MNSVGRRHWKLAVIRTLSAGGLHIATVRRTVGSRAFNEVLDRTYEAEPDPVRGADLVCARLEERYGHLLERPMAPWSRD